MELWKCYNEDYWKHFQQNIVLNELHKNLDFYNKISREKLFDDDIYKALACLSFTMFRSDLNNYEKWLDNKIPALDNYTPKELSTYSNGMNWIREYLLRS
jgi:hypothetical protein